MDILVIGIAGGTGSGKTTVTNKLKERFRDDITVMYHDNYYKAHDDMDYAERCLLNYDHPDSFDTELMIEHLTQLKNGESIDCPVYDYTEHNRSKETTRLHPAKVIIVEGILIFENKALCDLCDIRLFVDTDADTRILRRIMRDVKKRGRTLDSVVSQYLTTVKPMHEQFVDPSKKNAHLIMLEGGRNTVALDVLFKSVEAHLN